MYNQQILFNILKGVNTSNTLTAIAKQLYLTEPYVSKVLRQAESHFDTKLINRDPKPIRLTSAGETILKDLEKVIESQNQLEYDMKDYQERHQLEVRVAFNQPWLELVSDKIAELIKSHPTIVFSLTELTTNLAQDALLNHRIDLFVGKRLINEQVNCLPIGASQLAILVPKSWNLEGPVTPQVLQRLNGESFISLTDDSFFEFMVDRFFQENEIHLRKVVKVQNSLVAGSLAAKGIGFTVGSENIAKRFREQADVLSLSMDELVMNNGVSCLTTAPNLLKELADEIAELMGL